MSKMCFSNGGKEMDIMYVGTVRTKIATMLGTFSFRGARIVSAALLCAIVLLVFPILRHDASAQVGGCRSDPTVVLSNGAVVDLSATMADTASDVQRVEYVLHAPTGTQLLAFIETDGVIGMVEHFKLITDNPADTYDSYTTIHTGKSAVLVTAYTDVVSLPTLGVPIASGLNEQTLHIHLAPSL